jgi:diguanylate cyclase (GGDEF)-like protein
VSAAVLILDVNTRRVVAMNSTCRRTLGMATGQHDGAHPLADILGEAAIADIDTFVAALPEDGARNALYVRAETAFGPKPIVMHFSRMDADGAVLVVTIDDLAPFFDSSAPESGQNTFRSIVQTLPLGIEIYDRNLRGIFHNDQSDAWFMYDNYADSDLHEWWVPAFPDPIARADAMADWDELIAQARDKAGCAQTAEWRVMCSDGVFRDILFRLSMIGDHFTLVFWDVSEHRRLEGSLRSLASTDTLTGVYNRRHFFDQAALMFRAAREQARPLSLLMVDVDHFKSVNDRFGHRAGDQALVWVAERCTSSLREGDILARIGGEEFVVLLPDTTAADARDMAARLHSMISADPILLDKDELRLTVSIGVASSRADTPSFEMLIESADAALYTAKRLGRDRVVSSADHVPSFAAVRDMAEGADMAGNLAS